MRARATNSTDPSSRGVSMIVCRGRSAASLKRAVSESTGHMASGGLSKCHIQVLLLFPGLLDALSIALHSLS